MTTPSATAADDWRPLREELSRWAESGRVADLWLRDDDAVEVTPALETLAGLCRRHEVPCLIAAIPARASPELAAYVAGQPLLSVAQHGFSHRNHATGVSKAQEFPPDRPQSDSCRDLRDGHARLSALFGATLLPLYVPPWNRIAPEIAALLPGVGFKAISTFGRKPLFQSSPPLMELNTHVDIIDWRGNHGGRDAGWLAADLAGELQWSRETGGHRGIGVLTHHLVHDAPAWKFLASLLTVTAEYRCVRWRSAAVLAGLE